MKTQEKINKLKTSVETSKNLIKIYKDEERMDMVECFSNMVEQLEKLINLLERGDKNRRIV